MNIKHGGVRFGALWNIENRHTPESQTAYIYIYVGVTEMVNEHDNGDATISLPVIYLTPLIARDVRIID